MISHLWIPRDRADDLAIHTAADVPNIIADIASWQNDRNARDGLADTVDVLVTQTVLEHVILTAFIGDLLLFGRFDAANDNVLTAEVLDLFLGFEAGTFTDGQHGDHRTDAENNAENC